MGEEENRLALSGRVESGIAFSHAREGTAFYRFTLAVTRASGAVDRLPVVAAEHRLHPMLGEGDAVELSGQLRTYSVLTGNGGSRLLVTAFAKLLVPLPEAVSRNEVALAGSLAKPPVYRMTPMRREIADLLLTVERGYGRVDCLPVIAWGGNARRAAELSAGDAVRITGRFQSRDYQKTLPTGQIVTRTAYEVSAASLEC